MKKEKLIDGYVVATDITFTVDTNKETQHLEMIDKVVEVVKTDFVTGEEVEGAELQVVDEEGNIIDEWISSKEAHKVKGLKEGKTYQLLEKTCPYGYEIAESIEFTVSKDKETQKIEMKDMPILQSVKLIKKDSKNEEIIKDKFVFGIFEDEGCTKLIEEVESDKKQGIVLFENLRYGVFFIKELSAPKGYMLSDQVIKVEINDKGVFIDGEKVEGEDSVYTFEFYNTPIDTPKTGDNSNMIGLIALLVMSALTITGIGVHEYRKRKDNK